jgi:hypothetical protein
MSLRVVNLLLRVPGTAVSGTVLVGVSSALPLYLHEQERMGASAGR